MLMNITSCMRGGALERRWLLGHLTLWLHTVHAFMLIRYFICINYKALARLRRAMTNVFDQHL